MFRLIPSRNFTSFAYASSWALALQLGVVAMTQAPAHAARPEVLPYSPSTLDRAFFAANSTQYNELDAVVKAWLLFGFIDQNPTADTDLTHNWRGPTGEQTFALMTGCGRKEVNPRRAFDPSEGDMVQGDAASGQADKDLHRDGGAALVKWVIGNRAANRFTGLFARGTKATALLRLSSGVGAPTFAPGVGLSFPRNHGLPSVKNVFMHSLDGQENTDPFLNVLSNVFVKPPFFSAATLLEPEFTAVGRENHMPTPVHMPVVNFASATLDADVPSRDTVIPYQMYLVPSEALHSSEIRAARNSVDEAGKPADFRKILRNPVFSPGVVLYTIWAIGTPESPAIQLGTITLETHFVVSDLANLVKITHPRMPNPHVAPGTGPVDFVPFSIPRQPVAAADEK